MRTARCEHCDAPAACVGAYENTSVLAFACDDCCGHGCEDGECWRLEQAPSRSPPDRVELVTRSESIHELAALVKEAGGTMRLHGVPLDVTRPSPETGTAAVPTAQPKSDRAKALGLPCGGCEGNCGPDCTCDCHHEDTNLLPAPAGPAPEPVKPPATCACVRCGNPVNWMAHHVDANGYVTDSGRDCPAADVCEHGDHPAPNGKRFCSEACAACEQADQPMNADGTSDACAGLCAARTPAAGTAPKGEK